MKFLPSVAALLLFASPATAQADPEEAFAGALRGCSEWVLNPASWIDGPDSFLAAIGPGIRASRLDGVPERFLPPEELRRGNFYWRIDAAPNAGYVLVVSDQLPMCHIVGAGEADLLAAVERVLASSEVTAHWEEVGRDEGGGMASTQFRSRAEPDFVLVVSRTKGAGDPLRIQVLATGTYDPSR